MAEWLQEIWKKICDKTLLGLKFLLAFGNRVVLILNNDLEGHIVFPWGKGNWHHLKKRLIYHDYNVE